MVDVTSTRPAALNIPEIVRPRVNARSIQGQESVNNCLPAVSNWHESQVALDVKIAILFLAETGASGADHRSATSVAYFDSLVEVVA